MAKFKERAHAEFYSRYLGLEAEEFPSFPDHLVESVERVRSRSASMDFDTLAILLENHEAITRIEDLERRMAEFLGQLNEWSEVKKGSPVEYTVNGFDKTFNGEFDGINEKDKKRVYVRAEHDGKRKSILKTHVNLVEA